MNRPGEPTVEELMARIAALQAQNRQLAERVVKLEEELALARLHRFAPKSEKHIHRLFNEAEQAADEDDADGEDGDVADLPDTGLPASEGATGKKRGRKALPENLPRERVEYDLPDDQKACPCCRHQMHRMGEATSSRQSVIARSLLRRYPKSICWVGAYLLLPCTQPVWASRGERALSRCNGTSEKSSFEFGPQLVFASEIPRRKMHLVGGDRAGLPG